MGMLKFVMATCDVVGFHCWLEAPDEVGYLAHPHRHVFKVVVECAVTDANRQVEFHMLKRRTLKILESMYLPDGAKNAELMFGARSCEMIAEEVLDAFLQTEPDWDVRSVQVWEDMENGARVAVGS
jgi:hypothetical protein